MPISYVLPYFIHPYHIPITLPKHTHVKSCTSMKLTELKEVRLGLYQSFFQYIKI